jgi:hypothetical protein
MDRRYVPPLAAGLTANIAGELNRSTTDGVPH